MKVQSFMLADAASALESKLYIHGGGFTRITTGELPFVRQFAFVAQCRVEDGDDGAQAVGFSLKGPAGTFVVPEHGFNVDLQHHEALAPGEPLLLNFTVTVNGLLFQEAGVHEAELWIQRAVVASLPLVVVLDTEAKVNGESRQELA